MRILLIGMNHRTAPLDMREAFATGDPGPALSKLVDCEEISEAVLVSTCNRVELVVATDRVDDARLRVQRFFHSDLAHDAPASHSQSLGQITYEYQDRDAVRHIFRVASSLDSMVVGEPQILGQLKDAYRHGVEHRSCGPVLSRLFQRAFATAKRVKNETRISERPVSVARVAVDLARQIFEDFADKRALLLGAGEMIELALRALQREGLGNIRIANRTLASAEELASRFAATAHSLDEIGDLLMEVDIVLSCVGGDRPILDFESVRVILEARRTRPVFFIDIGVPRNVAPRIQELDNAYVYDMEDLRSVADSNAGKRQQESSRGEEIVNEEQLRFEGWMAALKAVPTIRHLRARAEAVRVREIAKVAGRLDLDQSQREGVEALTRAIVNKVLHAPVARLRNETESEVASAAIEEARALFALEDSSAPGAEADENLHAEMERARLGETGATDATAIIEDEEGG